MALATGLIALYDLRTDIAQILTSEGHSSAHFPVWSPDGTRVAFAARPTDGDLRDDIYSFAADFSGTAEPLLEYDSSRSAQPYAFSPSGELVFRVWLTSGDTGEIWMLPVDGGEPRLVVGGEGNKRGAGLSPDGRWLVYSSNRSGQEEVYVEPFPDGRPRVQVSPAGGGESRWSPAGDELFYRSGAKMVAVPVTLEPAFAITGESLELFENDAYARADWQVPYDVDHDGPVSS